ncbi:VOC family protein [Verrucosispora sp. WMMA2044]|uniref:VOC family protein n=1 Tax=Verrucosispora sioxanthis TaxID=2499994 RepID=A0A6M1L4X2_9ACTN|nr:MULTISPECIES: VOC family protein [Micromonospora]NEE62674.1 VOC family protein [Verrucosispora sioxanthis]NGM11784.1 VOC family protein [Verrucosispora sioxanthis]WBB47046.1 VOC family protein [Verrucosispora sp. WMMA2044]
MAEPTALASELFPIITAADLDAALRFYEGLLGGRVEYRFPETGEAAYVSLRFGDGQLGIGRQEAGEQPAGPVTLWVYVADCAAALARLVGAGVEVLAEPQTQPWGERMAIVRDPDGNRVLVADHG